MDWGSQFGGTPIDNQPQQDWGSQFSGSDTTQAPPQQNDPLVESQADGLYGFLGGKKYKGTPTYEQYRDNKNKGHLNMEDIAPKEFKDRYSREDAQKITDLGAGFIPELLSMVEDVNTALGGGDPTKGNSRYTEEQKRALAEHPFLNAAKGGAQAAALMLPSNVAPAAGPGLKAALINAGANGAIKGAEYGFGNSKTGNEIPSTLGYAGGGALFNVLLKGLTSGMLSKTGVFRKMSEAADSADPIKWQDIVDQARDEVDGKAQSTKNALEKLIGSETPTPDGDIPSALEGIPNEVTAHPGLSEPSMYNYSGPLREDIPFSGGSHSISEPALSGKEALDLRVSLGKRLPGNFFEKLLSNVSGKKAPGEDEAIDILRRAVSDKLKAAAPNISTPDYLYHIYKQAGGDVPTWVKRILAGYATDKLVGNKFGGDVHALSDVLGGLLGGAI